LPVQTFLLDIAELRFRDPVAFADVPARLGDGHFLVLRFHQSQEDFHAAGFGKGLLGVSLGHGILLSSENLKTRTGPLG
jgi:hypothetical protein